MPAAASGKLRHWIELQEPQVEQDPVTGEPIKTWVPVASLWAEVTPSSGNEFVAAGAEQSEVRGRIMIRYRDAVSADMRIVHRGRYYNILAVLPDADSGLEHLTLMTGEGVRLVQ